MTNPNKAMDPTLVPESPEVEDSVQQQQQSVEAPILEDMVESYEPTTMKVQPNSTPFQPVLEDHVPDDEGVHVTAANAQEDPIDPVTGKSLPPRVDPLTGRLVHAKVDRGTAIQRILDEEEAEAGQFEEVYEEEVVAIQTPAEEEEWHGEPPIAHARAPEEPPSRAKQILEQRRDREKQRQYASMSAVRTVGEEQQMPQVQGRAYRPQRQRNGVPDNFFQVPVDHPVEASVRSQFEPDFGRGPPPPGVMQGQGPDHRNGFYQDMANYDTARDESAWAPTEEQQAALASFSGQPHRDNLDPSVAEQVAAERQRELSQFAHAQRNQIRKDKFGRPVVVPQQMPRVLSHANEPTGLPDDGGYDLIEQQVPPTLPRIVPQANSSNISAESRLVNVIQDVVKKELDARERATPQQATVQQQPAVQQQPFIQQQPMIQPQAMVQQPMFQQQQQPIFVPIIVQQPAPAQQPIYMMPQPMMQQQPVMQQPMMMPGMRWF